MTTRARTKAEWSDLRVKYLSRVGEKHGIRLTLRDHVWCTTEAGDWLALPGVTATMNPDQWWLGYMQEKFRKRSAVGAILLCASIDQPLLDFGLPGSLIEEIEPHLSVGKARAQLSFNVFRRSGRFELLLKGGRTLDITQRLGDLSWLGNPAGTRAGRAITRPAARVAPVASTSGRGVAEASEPYASGASAPPTGRERRFFARYTQDGLQPLDPVDLTIDAIYLVAARPTSGVPRNEALRRIVARSGPDDLPRDLAEQHDHYAHGTPRR